MSSTLLSTFVPIQIYESAFFMLCIIQNCGKNVQFYKYAIRIFYKISETFFLKRDGPTFRSYIIYIYITITYLNNYCV